MKRRIVPGLVAILVACCGWVGYQGYLRLTTDPAADGLAYAAKIHVSSDYTNVTNGSGSGDSCNCVQLWYVGPATDDPLTVFGAPGASWKPVTASAPPPSVPGGWFPLATGEVTAADTGHCYLDITRESRTYDHLPDDLSMFTGQLAGWIDGSLVVLELDIHCDRDVGRLG